MWFINVLKLLDVSDILYVLYLQLQSGCMLHANMLRLIYANVCCTCRLVYADRMWD